MNTDRLTNEEMGEFLESLGRSIRKESSLDIQEIDNYIKYLKVKKGFPELRNQYLLPKSVDNAKNILKRFRTNEEMRNFLQMMHKTPIPQRLSKITLFKLGIGILVTTNVNLDSVIEQWKIREETLTKADIYNMSQNQFVTFFQDNKLFPDGYSIMTFAKRYKIKLPYSNDKDKQISFLFNKLFQRPYDSKKIGQWGLDKEGAK